MNIDNDLILRLEKLSKLRLSAVEREKLKVDLSKVIDMFGKIAKADTQGVAPLIHMSSAPLRLREDEAQNFEAKSKILELSEHVKSNYYTVPKVIE